MSALPASSPALAAANDPTLPRRPVVIVTACNRVLGGHVNHVVDSKYIDAVRLAGCLPLVVPVATEAEIDELLDQADGVMLTGSASNVHPSNFGEEVLDLSLPLDQARDAWTLPLIPRAMQRGVPLLAICRGLQEVNVAFGGSLHQAVQQLPGKMDHRSRDDDPDEVQYGPAHEIYVVPGGRLDEVLGPIKFQVNSLHGQGVHVLAEGLRAEACAVDGIIEAFSRPAAPAFNLCVQWHPEWRAADNPESVKLFDAFGEACRAYRDSQNPRRA
ncbi:gamma-glutamyl-gamma-aminobutyrate hydrolase family protein [soil metagenome]